MPPRPWRLPAAGRPPDAGGREARPAGCCAASTGAGSRGGAGAGGRRGVRGGGAGGGKGPTHPRWGGALVYRVRVAPQKEGGGLDEDGGGGGAPPVPVGGQVSLRGLPPLLAAEVLY